MRVNCLCVGKSHEEIVSEVVKAFSSPLIAVQIGFDTIRVTVLDVESFRTAYAKMHVPVFGINCVVQGGGPPLTMVHIFDYPAEFSDDPVKQVLSGFGEVRNVKRQKYIGRPDIETSTRLVLMAFRVIPPRLVSIDGYFCRLWFKGQPIICNLCNVQGHKPQTVPIETNVDAVEYLRISPDLAPIRGALRGLVIRVWPQWRRFRLFRRQLALGRLDITLQLLLRLLLLSAPRGLIVLWMMLVILTWTVVVFSPGSLTTPTAILIFPRVGSVKSPVRPASMETRRVENTPSHDAGKDIDVNNVSCSSSAASAVDGPAASFDVNNNIDSCHLSPVNNNVTFTGSVTAANGGPNTFRDLNVNAFSGTASAPLNVNSSCSKVTAAASGASVYSNLKTVTVEATANSGVDVNTHCFSNIHANSSSNKTATATSSEDVHSISKTVDIETTANSGVNVNILCDSNIEVNSTSNKSASETSCGNVHSISKIVNVEATANSGDSSSNVNVDAETTENGGVGANMSNDKAIDKGTVDSGTPLK